MPERPLLILPSPGEPVARRRRSVGGGKLHLPSPQRQAERLSPQFERLQQTLEERRARLQMEDRDLVPEEVVVLETVGTVDDFIRAVEAVPGMEWLAEVETEGIPPDDDFFALAGDGEARSDKDLRGRIFLVFTNQAALQQMVSLWEGWQSDRRLPRGLGRWKILFQQLRDVRCWGVRDRLQETGILEDWDERVEPGQELAPCEIELWRRLSPEQRRTARSRVGDLVEDMAGEVIAEADIEEIAYHALLVHLPVAQLRPLLEWSESDVALVQCEQIQFFRVSGQRSTWLADELQDRDEEALPEEPPAGSPIVALFDGLPLQAHRRLQGRLVVMTRTASRATLRPSPAVMERRWRRSFSTATWPRAKGLSRCRCTSARSFDRTRVTGGITRRPCLKERLWSTWFTGQSAACSRGMEAKHRRRRTYQSSTCRSASGIGPSTKP